MFLFRVSALALLAGQALGQDHVKSPILLSEEDIPGFNVSSCSGTIILFYYARVLHLTHSSFVFLDTGAPSCGTAMSSFNGVSAKSNGYDQCTGSCCGGSISTGCAYQCVELAQRYFNEKFGITKIWYDNANMMCSSYPSGVSRTTNPQPGDLWVRTSGTYGHVAVTTAVHSNTVDVIEQNSSPSGKNTYAKSDAGCFLTAQKNSGKCHHLGYYCGDDGLGKSPNNLYYCKGIPSSIYMHIYCNAAQF